MTLITVSRQSGSRSEEIIELVARTLGLQLIDKHALEEDLIRMGLPEQSLERFDEKKPGFWELFSLDRDRYYHYLKASILDHICEGDHIVVGRGAPIFLAGIPGILHVRITAPMEVRVRRIMEQNQCDEHHARKLAHQSDHNRAGYYHVFFNADWTAPDLYDLVINTETLSPRTVVETIRATVEAPSFRSVGGETKKRISEMATAQRILTRILFEENVPVRFATVDVSDGVATIGGAVSTDSDIRRCEKIAREAEGIHAVSIEIAHVPETYEGPYM